jgi:hypothetical protein
MWVISVNPEFSPVFIAYIRDISSQKKAEQEHRKYSLNIKKTLVQTILAISRIVEIRDLYTAGHQHRVAHLAAALSETLKLSETFIEGVFLGALIHDIGKIAVPSEILSRPGSSWTKISSTFGPISMPLTWGLGLDFILVKSGHTVSVCRRQSEVP